MYTSELLDHIQAHMRGKPGGGGLEYGTDAQANAIGSSNTSGGGGGSGSTNNTTSKAEYKSEGDSSSSGSSQTSKKLNVDFRFVDKKEAAKKRRPIHAKLNSCNVAGASAAASSVDVLVLPFPGQLIKTLAGFLDFEDEGRFRASVRTISENYNRHKGSLSDVCDELYAMKFERGVAVVIIYSIEDHTFRTIVM